MTRGGRGRDGGSRRPLLAATMIVRDEAHQLADCLSRLEPVVDEVVVYDTGSRDGTREVASRAGARVVAGHWDDDFARARNAALDLTRARWALIVDADERLVADAGTLRARLTAAEAATGATGAAGATSAAAGLVLRVVSVDAAGVTGAAHESLRLVRTAGTRWHGRVHERLVSTPPDAPRHRLPAEVAHLQHLGYRDAATVRAKAERNFMLAQAEVDALLAAGSQDRAAGARALLDLARSALELDRRQVAVDALEAVREIVPSGRERSWATALLAQLLLDHGGFADVVLVLEAELRAGPDVDPRFADWLRAQALVALDRPEESLVLVRGVDRLVDPAGIERSLGPVRQAHAVLAAAAGRPDEARTALLAAMLDHGQVAGNGELLRTLFRERPGELADLLRGCDSPHLEAISAELRIGAG